MCGTGHMGDCKRNSLDRSLPIKLMDVDEHSGESTNALAAQDFHRAEAQ